MELLDLPIAELKSQLVNGKDFSLIMQFFFDRFVDEPCFLAAGSPTPVERVMAEAVSQVCASISHKTVLLSSWQISKVLLLNLIHGTVTTSDGLAVLIWATDINVGMLGIPNVQSGKVWYARLTVSKAKAERAN